MRKKYAQFLCVRNKKLYLIYINIRFFYTKCEYVENKDLMRNNKSAFVYALLER